jgi:hypothetical protein
MLGLRLAKKKIRCPAFTLALFSAFTLSRPRSRITLDSARPAAAHRRHFNACVSATAPFVAAGFAERQATACRCYAASFDDDAHI